MLRKGQRGAGPDHSQGRGGRQADTGPDRYKMREKLVSIGDDYWIETQRGRRAYHVDGKAFVFVTHSSSKTQQVANYMKFKPS